MMKFSIVVPTYNAGPRWQQVIDSILMQTLTPHCVYVVDSESSDNTLSRAKSAGFRLHQINKKTFDHGATRQLAVEALDDSDIIVFLTHDAVFAHKDALKNLLPVFDDEGVGAAYGRQLPRKEANEIEAHARLFNYPEASRVKSLKDRNELGFKTVFVSNSFAAYRRTALMDVDGFPETAILSEDTCVVAKMLLKDWKLVYCAEAQVRHSHNLSYVQEFQRYFDIGVFHMRENWIGKEFGNVHGEGKRFVLSELSYLIKNNFLLIPSSILRTALKYIAYRLGKIENRLPVKIKKRLSMNKGFWDKENNSLSKEKPSVLDDNI